MGQNCKCWKSNKEIVTCDCGDASMEFEVIGEDLWSAVAINTKISKDGYGKKCTCKTCGQDYDTFDHYMVKYITHKNKCKCEHSTWNRDVGCFVCDNCNERI
jgi:hypothetical protein